ncbi:MAG: hypothetical protein KA140_06040 [Caldisericia bacterium]|nr:hypothetical protein [Caldisericia bacterium]
MKYLKMILLPIVMIVVAMLIIWGMMVTADVLQMLLTALMIASMVGLIAWDFAGLKTAADRIIAAVLIIVIGGALKVVMFFVLDWPWVAMGQPKSLGYADVIARLWMPLLNWWTLAGLVLGSAIAALGMYWIVKNNKM